MKELNKALQLLHEKQIKLDKAIALLVKIQEEAAGDIDNLDKRIWPLHRETNLQITALLKEL